MASLAAVLSLGLAGCGGDAEAASDAAMTDLGPRGMDVQAGEDLGTEAGAPADLGRDGAGPRGEAGALEGGVDAGVDGASAVTPDAGRDGGLDGAVDASGDRGGDAGEGLVEVRHEREFRAAWVATVSNLDWPSRQGLSAAQQQRELDGLLDVAAATGLNAVLLQVRPEGDALYRSQLEPWSRFLTGRQGGDPGYDPLAYAVEAAHRRGLELHAWLNPYRARTSATNSSVAPHISVTNPAACISYNNILVMNPALAVVQDRAVAVVEDIARRYAVDGIHFDDYFYPYPVAGVPFADDGDYQRFRAGGGTLSLADWRRDNVNRLIERVGRTVATVRPTARFGVSPFGIWRPGNPVGISGLDAFASIYCDAPHWMRQGWVDYLAPQLYWPSTQTAQAYGPLVRWWAETTRDGRSVFGGNALSRLGSSSAWTAEEIGRQITLTRAERGRGARGNVFFTLDALRTNRLGVADLLRREFYQRPALPPPVASRRGVTLAPPRVAASGRAVTLSHPSMASVRGWVFYVPSGVNGWVVERIVASGATAVTLGPGRWVVTAAGWDDVESQGVAVTLP